MLWFSLALIVAVAVDMAHASRKHLARRRDRWHPEFRRAGLASRGSSASLSMNAETPQDFYNWFNFDTSPDTSGGTVQYVTRQAGNDAAMLWTGQNGGLAFGPNTRAYGQNPRHSLRLTSNQTWGYGVYIWDVSHAPSDCGTWPALWTTTGGKSWPTGGELDVYEGVNGQGNNQGTLHTGVSCNQAGWQTGKTDNSGCEGGSGCGVQFSGNNNTFGEALNKHGGGVFAMAYTSQGISMWKFDRSSAPDGTKRGQKEAPDIGSWPQPDANWQFGNNGCPASSVDENQVIVMNIDFCGWAGSSPGSCNFGSSGCADYVANNPDKFGDSYFDINRFALWTWS